MWHPQSFVSKATQKRKTRRDQHRHLESEVRTSEKRDKLKDRERDQGEQKIKSRPGIRATKEDRNTKNE